MSAPSTRRCSVAVSTSTLALSSVSWATSRSFWRWRLVVQQLGAVQLRARQHFVGHGLPVIGERRRDIGALHAHQQLALGHRVAQPGVDFHHAAGGQRNHRHVARDIGADDAGYVQLTGQSGARQRLTRGNCSGWSTLTILASGSFKPLPAEAPRPSDPGYRHSRCSRPAAAPPRTRITDAAPNGSLNDLPAHRHVHLGARRSGTIRSGSSTPGECRGSPSARPENPAATRRRAGRQTTCGLRLSLGQRQILCLVRPQADRALLTSVQ